MKRYSKRVRKEAALLLSVMASSDLNHHHKDAKDRDFEATLGVSHDATELAWLVWEHVASTLGWPADITAGWIDAEAESLVRTGFPFEVRP